jgi:hypothetical protein
VLFEMAEQGLGHALLFLVVETKLDGVIAVGSDGFGLDDAIRANLDDGDRDKDSMSVIDVGLAELFSEQSEHKVKF